jgi:hypothetical protein
MGNRLILRALLVIIGLLCLTDFAHAQCSGQPSANQFCAGPTTGSGLPGWRLLVGADLPAPLTAPIQVNTTVITGGTSGLTPYNNAGKYGEFTMGGDCTLAVPSITCTKTGGAVFALSATTDTTNAGNIGSGTLSNSRLATGFLTVGTGLTPAGALAGGGTIAADIATVGNFEAGTANKLLAADKVFTGEVAVTFSATPTFDFNTFINASITLTANISSTTFSNIKAGQAGIIRFIQDGTGGRTIPATLNANLKCAGGCSFTLSTAANAVDALAYQCVTATFCLASLLKGMQ